MCRKGVFMSKLKKVIFLMVFLVVIGMSSSVFAMTPTYTYEIRYSRGVGNTCYYVDSTASTYVSSINTAANRWVHTNYGDNPIYMTAVSSTKATHMDIYASKLSSDYSNTNAYTTIWSSSAEQMSFDDKSNYYYAEIMINKNNMTSSTENTSTIVHEMGHCFGLDHSSSKYSIMYGTKSERKVTTVQQCDNDTINYLY